jgi:hypothetical protein
MQENLTRVVHRRSKSKCFAPSTSAVIKYYLFWLGINSHSKKLRSLVLKLKVTTSELGQLKQTIFGSLHKPDSVRGIAALFNVVVVASKNRQKFLLRCPQGICPYSQLRRLERYPTQLEGLFRSMTFAQQFINVFGNTTASVFWNAVMVKKI